MRSDFSLTGSPCMDTYILLDIGRKGCSTLSGSFLFLFGASRLSLRHIPGFSQFLPCYVKALG